MPIDSEASGDDTGYYILRKGNSFYSKPCNAYQDEYTGFSCGGTLTDARDSKTYSTIQIGTQCWMAENINVGIRTNGANSQGSDCSSVAAIEKYCYSDTESNCTSGGGLYQWSQIMCGAVSCNGTGAAQPSCSALVQGICPNDWHIPSHYELVALEREVCDSGICVTDFPYDEVTTGWRGTNESTQLQVGGSSEFEAILTGYRDTDGTFDVNGTQALFWSSTEGGFGAWNRVIFSGNVTVYRNGFNKNYGLSIRCVQD